MNSNKNKFIIPFAGYPIFVIQKGFYVNDDELNFIKNIEYNNHVDINNLKLSKNEDVLEFQQLKRLKNFIKESLDDYVSNILEVNNSFSFCQSWSTIQNGKTKHPSHTHPNHLISSVYYVKNHNVFNSHSYKVILKQGDIIFFPGQLHHESSINDEKERIVMGSSFFIEGKLGSQQGYDNLDITNNKRKEY